jgi:hypothetical protein
VSTASIDAVNGTAVGFLYITFHASLKFKPQYTVKRQDYRLCETHLLPHRSGETRRKLS